MDNPYFEGIEVFKWSETQALLKRLGVDTNLPLRDITIEIPLHGLASTRLEVLAHDKSIYKPPQSK